MVRLVIKGGIGNQMFQYAAAYSLARKLGTEVLIDLSFIGCKLPVPGFTPREYELSGIFDLDLKTTSVFKNDFLNDYFSYPVMYLQRRIQPNKFYYERDPYEFDSDFFKIGDNTIIEGFFNNHRYFEGYSDEIKEIYDIDKLYNPDFKDIEDKIRNTNSVSVSIRRGDYLNKKHSKVFVNLGDDYYRKAIKLIKSRIENPYFFIFSPDDEKWFKEVLSLSDSEYYYLGKDKDGSRASTDLRLISLCKHNIIPNSTFSFWGAYLNDDPEKIVVAPKRWSYIWQKFSLPDGWCGNII